MADHSERIAEIQELLRSGVTKVMTAGTVTEFSPESLRQELRDLMADDDTMKAMRPRVRSINLGNRRILATAAIPSMAAARSMPALI